VTPGAAGEPPGTIHRFLRETTPGHRDGELRSQSLLLAQAMLGEH
jgi:hypothetical protein